MALSPNAVKFILLALSLLGIGWLIYNFMAVVLPLIVAGALAYLAYPVTQRIEGVMPWRERWPEFSRILAVFTVLLAAVGVIAGALILIIPVAVEQAIEFIEQIPELLETARATVEQWNYLMFDRIPEEIRQEFQGLIRDAGAIIAQAAQGLLTGVFAFFTQALTFLIGALAVPFFLYYLLKDGERIKEGLISWFPDDARKHARNVIDILNRVLGSYVKAQLVLAFSVGVMVATGLSIVGVEFAIFLGIVAGLFDLAPIIGPWLGAIPGVIVVLATSPGDILWVILVYFVVQQIESILLAPRIQGQILRAHPVLILLVLLAGSQIAGIWGIILGPPLAVAALQVIKYFRQAWSEPVPLQVIGDTSQEPEHRQADVSSESPRSD